MSKPTRPRSRTSAPFRPPARRAPALVLLASALAITPSAPASGPSGGDAPREPSLAVVERSVAQDQGGWVVNYRLRYRGEAGQVVTPTEVFARLDGWVSNSRVAAHATPRPSSVVVSGPSGLSGTADVILAADESQRCRERVAVQVWTDDAPGAEPPAPAPAPASASPPAAPVPPADRQQPVLSLAPGSTVRVRLKLAHAHCLYGDYDPLLGERALELRLGTATVRDVLPLDREQYLAQSKYRWPAPPEDRRDTRHYVSGPDSLHLEAHVPGNQYYRFPEHPVRYGTKMKLSFWYYVAWGGEGKCRARVAQYKDTAPVWKDLSDAAHEEPLGVVGRWVKVERVFWTDPEATTLALDFQICNAEVGEVWVDDVTLEPVAGAPPASP